MSDDLTLREQLELIGESDPATYQAVTHFLYTAISRVIKLFPSISVDYKEPLRKEINIRYRSHHGLLWLKPDGRVGCQSVDMMNKRYIYPLPEADREKARQAARELRALREGIQILRSETDGDRLSEALISFLDAIRAKRRTIEG